MARIRNNLATPTRLAGALTSGATTITVDTTAGWPSPSGGDVALGCLSYPDTSKLELFSYTGKTSTTFTGVTRGVDDTDPKAHLNRALVVHVASADDLVTDLGDLADVTTAGANDNDVLTYDSGTQTWGPAAASTVAALGDLTDVDTTGAATDDVLVFDGSEWGPGAALRTYSTFIYNSSGAQAANRYNDWSDLMAVLQDQEGPKLILFEQSETIPAGSWDLDNTELRGNRLNVSGGGYTITFPTGVTVSSWVNARVDGIRVKSTSNAAILTTSGSGTFNLFNTGSIEATTSPFIAHSGAGQFVIGVQDSSVIVDGGSEVFHTSSAAFDCQLVIFRGHGAAVPSDVLSSDNAVVFIDVIGSVGVDVGSNPWPSTHTGLTVGFQLAINQTFAEALSFDPTGLAVLTETDVQNALAEVDAALDAIPSPIAAGGFTPTITDIANVATSITRPGHYTRIGNVVTFVSRVYVDPTAAATQTQVQIELPVAPDLSAATTPLRGQVSTYDGTGLIEGELTADEALLTFISVDTSSREVEYTITYEVA